MPGFRSDDRIVMISSLPGPWMVGWEKMKEGYTSLFGLTDCRAISHDPKLLRVDTAATHAWVSGFQDADFEYQGEVHRFEQTRFTWALEKQEGKWRIVQAHWSSPRELETAGESP